MKRYINSFFITSLLYLVFGVVFIYFLTDIKIEPKIEPQVTKISLNSVELVQKKTQKPIKKVLEPIAKPVVEKVVEKPAPKVVKKVEKIVEKPTPKPIEDVAKEEAITPVEPKIEQTQQEKVATIANEAKEKVEPTEPIVDINAENDYLAKVRERIDKCKVYPKAAKRLKQHGKVLVSFDIKRDGTIKNIKIIESSSYVKLDEASIKLLQKIASFEPIPLTISRAVWNIQVPIVYQYN